MARDYQKHLKHGGSRIIPRAGDGRFTILSMDNKICGDCGQIIIKESRNIGTINFPFFKYFWADVCPQCGSKNILI